MDRLRYERLRLEPTDDALPLGGMADAHLRPLQVLGGSDPPSLGAKRPGGSDPPQASMSPSGGEPDEPRS